MITLYQLEQRQGEVKTLYQVGLYPLVNDPLPVSPSRPHIVNDNPLPDTYIQALGLMQG